MALPLADRGDKLHSETLLLLEHVLYSDFCNYGSSIHLQEYSGRLAWSAFEPGNIGPGSCHGSISAIQCSNNIISSTQWKILVVNEWCIYSINMLTKWHKLLNISAIQCSNNIISSTQWKILVVNEWCINSINILTEWHKLLNISSIQTCVTTALVYTCT